MIDSHCSVRIKWVICLHFYLFRPHIFVARQEECHVIWQLSDHLTTVRLIGNCRSKQHLSAYRIKTTLASISDQNNTCQHDRLKQHSAAYRVKLKRTLYKAWRINTTVGSKGGELEVGVKSQRENQTIWHREAGLVNSMLPLSQLQKMSLSLKKIVPIQTLNQQHLRDIALLWAPVFISW